jgi:Zn-dependent M16 (insulinase) family peptidase
MKGAYQNPDRQLYIEMADKLFANTPYGYDSGGKPE